jgi:hypothetical protein
LFFLPKNVLGIFAITFKYSSSAVLPAGSLLSLNLSVRIT